MKSDIGQFDSRVEEIERQLHQALLSYGVSTLVSGESGTAKESGQREINDESSSADDMSKCMCCVEY